MNVVFLISLKKSNFFIELLTPDNKKRIKIKEIFNHLWVIEMESEVKEEMRKNSEATITSHSTNTTDSNKVLTIGQSQPSIFNQSNFKIEFKIHLKILNKINLK